MELLVLKMPSLWSDCREAPPSYLVESEIIKCKTAALPFRGNVGILGRARPRWQGLEPASKLSPRPASCVVCGAVCASTVVARPHWQAAFAQKARRQPPPCIWTAPSNLWSRSSPPNPHSERKPQGARARCCRPRLDFGKTRLLGSSIWARRRHRLSASTKIADRHSPPADIRDRRCAAKRSPSFAADRVGSVAGAAWARAQIARESMRRSGKPAAAASLRLPGTSELAVALNRETRAAPVCKLRRHRQRCHCACSRHSST